MRSDREKPSDDDFGEEPQAERAKPADPHEKKNTFSETWSSGRLKQAEKLLKRFEAEFEERDAQDPNLLRDYYQWTGEPHYRTEYGWSAGLPEENDEDPADVLERVNC